MNEKSPIKPVKHERILSEKIGLKAMSKLRAKRNTSHGVWFGQGMLGLIGWSIGIPTLLGAALGMWLDKYHSGGHAWTMAMLAGGLVVGCSNAWHRVAKEEKIVRKEQDENDE